MSANREGCCAQYRKPCSYHEGWEDAEDALDQTIVCPTCGGSGLACAPGCYEESEHPPCPGCIRGRQPTPEVIERMATAMFKQLPVSEDYWTELALAAWLAEHKEDE